MLLFELLYKSVCSSLAYIADLLHIRALVIPSTVYDHIKGIQRRLQATDLATTYTEYVVAAGVREQMFRTLQHAVISSYDIVYHYAPGEDGDDPKISMHDMTDVTDKSYPYRQPLQKMILDRCEDYNQMTVTVERLSTVYTSLCELAEQVPNSSVSSLASSDVEEVAALETFFNDVQGASSYFLGDVPAWMPRPHCP